MNIVPTVKSCTNFVIIQTILTFFRARFNVKTIVGAAFSRPRAAERRPYRRFRSPWRRKDVGISWYLNTKKHKIFITFILSLMFTFNVSTAFANNQANAETDFAPITGLEMMQRLSAGMNIHNSLEARGQGRATNNMDTQTLWGEPLIEEWHFEAMAQKGLKSVRLPVSWGSYITGTRHTIDKQWLDRVQQCVDWALDAGLYVIINTHHEHEFYDMMHSSSYAQAKRWLTNVWGQIAERFKHYDERLIFEPMNEPRPGRDGWYWDRTTFFRDVLPLMNTTNKLNHDALSVIRASGGYNDKRVVALTVVQADASILNLYEPPDDAYTMVGVFVYPSGTDEQLVQIQDAVDCGVAVMVKETSPLDSFRTNAARIAWSKEVYTFLADLGVPSMMWAWDEDVLFNRRINRWNKSMVNTLFRAYGIKPGEDYGESLQYPFELQLDANAREGYTFWSHVIGDATKLIVEITAPLEGWYSFARYSPRPEWRQFDNGDTRITYEQGRIIFNLSGLSGNTIGFAPGSQRNLDRVKRVYLDK